MESIVLTVQDFGKESDYAEFTSAVTRIAEGEVASFDGLARACKLAVQEAVFGRSLAPLSILLGKYLKNSRYSSLGKLFCSALCSKPTVKSKKDIVHYYIERNILQFDNKTGLYSCPNGQEVQEAFKENVKRFSLQGAKPGPQAQALARILHWLPAEKAVKPALNCQQVYDLLASLDIEEASKAQVQKAMAILLG